MASELDLINEADAAAPDANFTNYGKFDWKVNRYIVWKDGQPREVTAEEYAKAPAQVKGDDGKMKSAKNVELKVSADIQEFKPELSFTYERKINIGDMDWNRTFKPSLEKVLNVKIGKGELKDKEISVTDALNRIKGQYAAYQDVPQLKQSKDGKTYKTMKLVRLFKSREECVAAMNGTPAPTGANGNGGPAFTVAELNTIKKHADLGAAGIVADWVGPKTIERFGGESATIAAVKQVIG